MRGKSFFGTNKKTFSGSTEKVFFFEGFLESEWTGIEKDTEKDKNRER